jgi:hypothetical protein
VPQVQIQVVQVTAVTSRNHVIYCRSLRRGVSINQNQISNRSFIHALETLTTSEFQKTKVHCAARVPQVQVQVHVVQDTAVTSTNHIIYCRSLRRGVSINQNQISNRSFIHSLKKLYRGEI